MDISSRSCLVAMGGDSFSNPIDDRMPYGCKGFLSNFAAAISNEDPGHVFRWHVVDVCSSCDQDYSTSSLRTAIVHFRTVSMLLSTLCVWCVSVCVWLGVGIAFYGHFQYPLGQFLYVGF